MTIRRGQTWGEARQLPTDIRVVDDDLALHHWVVDHRRRQREITDVGVRRGDLARTCGGGADGRFDDRTAEVMYVPIDIVRVTADPGSAHERTTWSVAHVVARRSWWRGEVHFVMNAEFYGAGDVVPRGHPNDGRVEVLRVDPAMPWRARWAARRRARSGSHLPHPQLATRQGAALSVVMQRPLVVWVDGERWGQATTLRIEVEPDAMHVYL